MGNKQLNIFIQKGEIYLMSFISMNVLSKDKIFRHFLYDFTIVIKHQIIQIFIKVNNFVLFHSIVELQFYRKNRSITV